jgi:ABC-type branched-subunit amino acid transport system substrate-binding protein
MSCKQFAGFIIALILCLTKLATSATTSLTIGGVFNVFDANGNVDLEKLQHLTAFQMAVDEINEDATILPNIQLNYVIRSVYDARDAVEVMREFVDEGAVGVVDAITGDASYALNEAANVEGLVLFNSQASSSFIPTAKYAYSFETNPIESYQSTAIRTMFCIQRFKRMIIYATQDDEYMQLVRVLSINSKCTIDIVGTYVFPFTQTDFTREIKEGLDDSVTAVFVFMPEDTAVRFMQQAHDLGLARKGVLLVGSSNLKSSSFIAKVADPTILKGFLTWTDFPLYPLYANAKGIKFVQNFAKLNSSVPTCANYMDDTGYRYLYRNGSASSGACVGLDTSTFTSPTMLTSNLAYTYDSVYALAHALDTLIKNNLTITADNLVTKVFTLKFAGASGQVSYSKGDPASAYDTRGNRAGGVYYMMYNYQIAGNTFYPVLVLSVELGPRGCVGLPNGYCKSAIFNSVDGTTPNGYPAYALAKPPSIIRIAGIFNLYDSNGVANKEQVECLAAFLMAVHDVNNKAEGTFNQLLPNSQVKVQAVLGSDFTELVSKAGSLNDDYFGAGVTGVVSALSSRVNLAANQVLTNNNIVQVNSVAVDVQQGSSCRRLDVVVEKC